jgi:hypothetical protein
MIFGISFNFLRLFALWTAAAVETSDGCHSTLQGYRGDTFHHSLGKSGRAVRLLTSKLFLSTTHKSGAETIACLYYWVARLQSEAMKTKILLWTPRGCRHYTMVSDLTPMNDDLRLQIASQSMNETGHFQVLKFK